MQTHGGEAAAAAIESRERQFSVRLTVDFERNGEPVDVSDLVDNISTDRMMKGSAPEEIMLIEGSSAAELKFDLSGELYGYPAVVVFSPFNGQSPFYNDAPIGAEVVYELGVETVLGTVWYPQFVGNVRTITPDRGNNVVEFTALDRVEKLRKPVRFAPFAVADKFTSQGIIDAQVYNSQAVIDHCLRHSDVSPTRIRPPYASELAYLDPNRPDGCLFWLAGTGAYHPLIGWRARQIYDNPPETDNGPSIYDQLGQIHPELEDDETAVRPLNLRAYPSKAPSSPADQESRTAGYWTAWRDEEGYAGSYYFGVTLALNPDGTNVSYAYNTPRRYLMELEGYRRMFFRIRCEAGKVWFSVQNDRGAFNESNKVDLPTGVDSVEVKAYYNLQPAGTSDTLYFQVGDVVQGPVSVPDLGAPPSVNNEDQGLILVNHDIGFNDLWFTFRAVGGLFFLDDPDFSAYSGEARPATYAASLDKGLQDLTYLPIRDGDDAWEVIQDVVGAEFGSAFWDEKGVFRFWNAHRIRSLQEQVVRRLTLDQVSGLQITNSLDSVRNVWSVDAGKKKSEYSRIYDSNDPDEFRVPGGGVSYIRLWVEDISAPDPNPLKRYRVGSSGSLPEWNDDVNHGYVCQWLVNGDWIQIPDRVNASYFVRTFYTDTGELMLRISNTWPEPVRLAGGSEEHGTLVPALRIQGTAVKEYPNVVLTSEDPDSVAKYGPRNLKLSGDWVQERLRISEVDEFLKSRTVEPIPTTDAITIAGDPRLQMGDTIEIKDPDGMGETLRVQILGISRTFSRDGGLEDVLTVELVRPSGVGIWDSEQYGIWDDTFRWS